MNKYLKAFELYSSYQTYLNNADYPHAALCLDLNKCYFGSYTPVTSITLNESSLSLDSGDSETLVATVLPANSSYRTVQWSSSNSEVATVSNGVVTAVGIGNATITASCDNKVAICNLTVASAPSYDYVEIGGLRWATMNVGATAVTDGGLYFQWGDTVGYTASQVGSGEGKKYFGWNDYKWTNDGGSTFTKYNSTDGKTVLDLEDDAARVNMGGNWRMPASGEMNSLLTSTTSAWTNDYESSGVSGLVLTSKADSNVKLFFPAVGFATNGSMNVVGSIGYVWSSSLNTSDITHAHLLGFDSGNAYMYHYSRYYGFSVRGVMDIPSS